MMMVDNNFMEINIYINILYLLSINIINNLVNTLSTIISISYKNLIYMNVYTINYISTVNIVSGFKFNKVKIVNYFVLYKNVN